MALAQISREEEYYNVMQHSGLILPDLNIIRLEGSDRRDFLQRLSTNDFRNIPSIQTVGTVLTNEKGRIIDFVTVIPSADSDFLVAHPDPEQGARAWLEKFIIMDDVTLTDLSDEFTIISLIGPNAIPTAVTHFHLDQSLTTGSSLETDYAGIRVRLYCDPLWHGARVNCLIARGEAERFMNQLRDSLPRVSDETAERLRVESGIPAFGKELSEHVNPLEAGLERFVSFSKGCYIGQEVIARIDTYRKLQKKLGGFLLEGTREKAGEKGHLILDGEEVGYTTSHIWSIALGAEIALGYIHTDVTSHEVLFVGNDNPKPRRAEVRTLPFQLPGGGALTNPITNKNRTLGVA